MRRSALLFTADNQPTPQFADFLRDIGIPGKNLIEIDTALQERFFQKNPDDSPKERWELDKVQLSCSPQQLKSYLAACGFIMATQPSAQVYNYAAWPGALVTRAVVRLNNLVSAWQNGVRWKETIVFGGKRPLLAEKESYEKCCEAMQIHPSHAYPKESWDANPPTNELEMMRWVWQNTMQPHSREKITTVPIFVDAPLKPPLKEGGAMIRPNTEDTIKQWMWSTPWPKAGSVLLSSGAPYGMAMDEAFWMLLEPRGFTVETFGHAAPELPIENLMREVAGTVNRIRRARKA